jgi:protein-disulfide isomerase
MGDGQGSRFVTPADDSETEMSTNPKPTKQERRDAARAARLDAERAAAGAARRRRRLRTLLAVLGAAALLVVVAILVSSGGSSDKAKNRPAAAQKATGAIPGQKESAAMLAGVPQTGIYLGNPAAPVRVVEFADLQCPFCREYSLQVLPQLVQDYVRSGKVRMEFRNLSFLGKDSVTAGRAAAAAAQQNRLWNFVDVFYYNQGEENTGYVTPAFLDRIYGAAGVDPAKAQAHAASKASLKPLTAANALADQLRVESTPSIFVGKRGGALTPVQADPTDVGAYKAAIDGALGQA